MSKPSCCTLYPQYLQRLPSIADHRCLCFGTLSVSYFSLLSFSLIQSTPLVVAAVGMPRRRVLRQFFQCRFCSSYGTPRTNAPGRRSDSSIIRNLASCKCLMQHFFVSHTTPYSSSDCELHATPNVKHALCHPARPLSHTGSDSVAFPTARITEIEMDKFLYLYHSRIFHILHRCNAFSSSILLCILRC